MQTRKECMQFDKITFKEYHNIRNLLLVSSENIKKEVYRDSGGIATIGIGINIGQFGGLWIKLILYYLFDLVKNIDEIPFRRFDNYNFKNIIKDTHSYKYKEYTILIDNITTQILQILKTDISTSTLNQIIKDTIISYTNLTQTLSKNQQQQRLNKQDLKIDSSDSNNPKYLTFTLNNKQAKELFDIIIINYEALTLSHLNNKQIYCFDNIKESDKTKKAYYKEFASLVSASYQSPNIIKNNKIIAESFTYNSRFLLWACVRYTLGKNIKRRILQSAIFGFNDKLGNETQEEQFNTCIDVFKVLNLKHSNNQSYLEYFLKEDKAMNFASDILKEYNQRNIKNKKADYLNNIDYAIYRSGYINHVELQALQNLLNPYVKLLDDLIPKAKFEDSTNFKQHKLVIDNKTQESRFKLHNIFIVNNANFKAFLASLHSYKITSQAKENILIFITEKIDCEIYLQKPNNAYLYLVSVKGNSFDCSFLNNPLNECNKANDECELLLYENHQFISLSTQELSLDSNKAESNNFFYHFYENALKIGDSNETLFTLTSFKTHIKKTDSNQYILDSTLLKDTFYSTLGIELKTPKEQDTFSNNGNFTLNISNIKLDDIQRKSNNDITNDSPIFCFLAESNQIFISKLKDNFISLKINIDSTIKKDDNNTLLPQNPTLIFLSFIPFNNTHEANNTTSQKLQLLNTDLAKGYKDINFKIPLLRLQNAITFKEWQISQKQITQIYFSYGKDKIKLDETSRHYKDLNLHIQTQGYEEGEEVEVELEFRGQSIVVCGVINDNQATIMNIFKEI